MALHGGEQAGVVPTSQDALLLVAVRRCSQVRTLSELGTVLAEVAVSLTSADGGFAAIRRGDDLLTHCYLHRGTAIPWSHAWRERDAFGATARDGLLPAGLLPEAVRQRFEAQVALGVRVLGPTHNLIALVEVHKADGEWTDEVAANLRALAELVVPTVQNVLAQEQLQEAENALESLRLRIVAQEDIHEAKSSLESLRVRVENALEQQQVLRRLLAQQDGLSTLLEGPGQKLGADRALLDYLRRSREQLAAILQGIDQGILVEDLTGVLVHVNDAAVRILGFASQSDLLGRNLVDLLAAVDVWDAQGREFPPEEIRRWVASGELKKGEVQLQVLPRSGGPERMVTFRTIPVLDEESNPRFAVTVFSDVTERLRMERMREQFLSMVTHELRSPLAVIKLGVSLVREDPDANMDTAMQVLFDIDGQADRLLTLIGNLLDMAQVEAGTFSVALSPSPVSAVLEEALARLPKPVAERTTVDMPPDLPLLHVDVQRMAQVLVNLLTNADKFAFDGSRIGLSAARSERQVTVSVTNSGPTIPRDQVPLLFRKFSKLGQRNSGTGLGLAISKHIVEAHAGRIWVESSEEDRLTTFTFSLPVS